jgi:hypothetical protein
VKSIRSGRYELLPENYTRCPSCGHDVKMPCPACAVKKQHAAPHFASGWIYFPTEAGSPEENLPTLDLDLKPKHYKRYLQIQKKKRRSLPDRTAVENPAALSGGSALVAVSGSKQSSDKRRMT